MSACNHWCNEKKKSSYTNWKNTQQGIFGVCVSQQSHHIKKNTICCVEFSVIIDFHGFSINLISI